MEMKKFLNVFEENIIFKLINSQKMQKDKINYFYLFKIYRNIFDIPQ